MTATRSGEMFSIRSELVDRGTSSSKVWGTAKIGVIALVECFGNETSVIEVGTDELLEGQTREAGARAGPSFKSRRRTSYYTVRTTLWLRR